MRVLITAGGTRNPLDAARYLAAASTGATGVALARALTEAGHEPFLLGSEEARLRAAVAGLDLQGASFGSTVDLMARVEAWVRAHPDGAVLHAAAVGDYAAAGPVDGKTPSGRASWAPVLVPTPKIADQVRGWGLVGPYVTFKALAPGTPPEQAVVIARRQRERTGSDLVFANVLGHLERVWLVGDEVGDYARREEAITALVRWVNERARSSRGGAASPLPSACAPTTP